MIQKKRTDLALKISSSSESSTSSEEEDLVLFTRRFKRMYQKGRRSYRKNIKKMFSPKANPLQKKKKQEVICFKCNKARHYKIDCPKLKKKSNKSKAMKAMIVTWSEYESTSSGEGEKKLQIFI